VIIQKTIYQHAKLAAKSQYIHTYIYIDTYIYRYIYIYTYIYIHIYIYREIMYFSGFNSTGSPLAPAPAVSPVAKPARAALGAHPPLNWPPGMSES